MTTTLSDLLANLSLSPLSTEPIASESLESLSAILSDSRPALLQKLARGGVSKLAERQKLANELARWRKAQRPSQTAPEAPHKTTPPADARATAASQPKIWDKGTAEDYMAAMHLMARKASHDLRDKHGLEDESSAEMRERLRRALANGTISEASASFLRAKLASEEGNEDGGGSPACVRSLMRMAEVGLPLPTLAGRDTSSVPPHLSAVPIWTTFPSAETFWSDHVLPSRPALLRGLLTPATWPPMRDFADFAYLRRRCGHRRVRVKALALDDAQGRPVFVGDPEFETPLSEFLELVEQAEERRERCPMYLGKVPLRTELPELDADIASAGTPPIDALLDCFGAPLPQGLYAYLGCAGNVTATHFDASENLMLCVYGTKRLWLYPPSDAGCLYPAAKQDGSRACAPPFQTFSELPEWLRRTFPRYADARPIEVSLMPGDILYLPACWWHCVEGSHERNMIISYWMDLHPQKRMCDMMCDQLPSCSDARVVTEKSSSEQPNIAEGDGNVVSIQ